MPNPEPTPTVYLLTQAQSGDRDALNQLLARYVPRLRKWASGRLPLGVRTMLDSADLVQDAIIGALKHLDTFEIRTEGALQAYLRCVVNNHITDLYRRARRRPSRSDMPELPAIDPSPLEQVIGAEALANYERALNSLKERERQAVILRVEFDIQYREIAEQLGIPSGDAARMLVTRAIARLSREMMKNG